MCAFCSTSSTVMPCLLMSWIGLKTSSTSTGASPIDGSSSSSTIGRALRAGEVAVAHPDGALPRAQDTGDRSQRRRLPGAVAADQRHDLALLHRERDALQRLDVAVVGVDLLDLEERHQATWSTMRPSPFPDTP